MTKNEDLKALLPCPFCGGEGEYYQPNEDIVVIACLTCNAESGYYDGEDSTTLDDAVKFWNTRNGKLTRPTVTPTDGDSERALEVFNAAEKCMDEFGDAEICGLHIAHLFDAEYCNTIKTALQSTRKPPVDTIREGVCKNCENEEGCLDVGDRCGNCGEEYKGSTPSDDTIAVPREMLQGVRAALAIILKTHDMTCKGKECQISGIDIGRVYLASLDAVLEGE